MSIKVDSLTKKFGSQTAVNQISFAATEKGVIGFLGPNGAGKSTTMKMITGYLEPDAGNISICGIDAGADRISAKEKIGYLPEGNPLYHEMYVREYLAFIASVRKVDGARDRINEVIEQTGLQPESAKRIGQLSKGYKQRVGLAAAILDDPEVLILDEPTSGLDPNQIIEIRELIKSLGKTKTVLFSSHILQEVESICDRVIIIHQGNIVADDRIADLKSRAASSSTVSVRFSSMPPADWIQSLDDVQGARESAGVFHLQTTDADRLRKQLMSFSLERDLNIISLDTHAESLEEIFKTLTKQIN